MPATTRDATERRDVSAEWAALLESASPCADLFLLRKLLCEVHWPTLLTLAAEHGVIAQLAKSIVGVDQEIVPPEIMEQIRDRQRMQIASAMQMTTELFRTLEVFRAAGLDTAALKGVELAARAYGDPAARQYGDLDFLVRHHDIERARESMIAAGYECDISLEAIRASKIPGQYLFVRRNPSVIVELHTERTMRYFPRPLPIDQFFARRTNVTLGGEEIPALCPEDDLILICIHGAKHLWERLAMVADVAAYVSRQGNLSWERALQTARNIGAERMLHVGLLLARDILKAPLPKNVNDAINKDAAGRNLVKRIATWLPTAGQTQPDLLSRARFRMHMRGGLLRGFGYLLRLTFSPTQEDWRSADGKSRHDAMEGLRRPIRLAKKYGREKEKP